MKYGFVYIWFDRTKKMYYIGSHWGTEDDGYICSSPWMMRAYNKRSTDFKRRILARHYERETLKDLEEVWLKLIRPKEIKVKYYNLTLSAKNAWHFRENDRRTVGQKISDAKKGKKTGPRDPSVGKAISLAKKGKAFTEEHKIALAKAQSGKKRSEESKRKASESLKGRAGYWTGRKMSEETKAKMRASHRARIEAKKKGA